MRQSSGGTDGQGDQLGKLFATVEAGKDSGSERVGASGVVREVAESGSVPQKEATGFADG